MSPLVLIRPGKEEDLPLVYSTWLKGLRHGGGWWGDIHQSTYYKLYHHVIAELLKQSTLSVACLKEDPDVVVGYCVSKDEVVHWVFTKKAWRKLGIAGALVPANMKVVSHLTKVGKACLPEGVAFNPFPPFILEK